MSAIDPTLPECEKEKLKNNKPAQTTSSGKDYASKFPGSFTPSGTLKGGYQTKPAKIYTLSGRSLVVVHDPLSPMFIAYPIFEETGQMFTADMLTQSHSPGHYLFEEVYKQTLKRLVDRVFGWLMK